MKTNLSAANSIPPFEAVFIDAALCIGCNNCVEVCRCDILHPTDLIYDKKTGQYIPSGKPPVLVFPEECWFCGCCVGHCPVDGAITLNLPLSQKATWKRKATGEIFRLDMKNPPSPNTQPPVGGWRSPAEGR